MRFLCLIVICQLFFFIACDKEKTSELTNGELIFQSGFEPDSKIVPSNLDADISGTDQSLNDHNDWVTDLDNHSNIGNFSLQYQGGDSTMRFAKIIAEPGKPENHVLHFWLHDSNVEGKKGRVQGNIYGIEKGMKEFYQSERVFLHNDFNTVRTFPNKISWLTIAEFWNNKTWDPAIPFGFRITLGIGKPVAFESDLYFILDGQDYNSGSNTFTTIWSETNNKVKVPIGKWFKLDYYYKEGDSKNGRFYMTIEPEGGKEEIIFDLVKITHNTKDPSPDGVTDFNPIKLYTSKQLIDYMRSQEKTLQIYWDDFNLWKGKHP